MSDIVITEFMDQAAVSRLQSKHSVLFDPTLVDGLLTDPGESNSLSPTLLTELKDCRALIVRNRTQVGAALLDAAPQVRCVGRLGVGLDNIDQLACKARGVEVYPATGANTQSVAEYVIAMVMTLLRGAYLSSHAVASGAWPRADLQGREISGQTLGLIGYGSIGRAVARKAHALGMRVIAHDPFLDENAFRDDVAQPAEIAELQAQASAISLHVPLTDQNRRQFGTKFFAEMRPGAVLINTARGEIVDEAALVQALRSGHLGGAALDVFADEPLSAPSGEKFAGLPNVVLTPHIAGLTQQSNARVSDMIADRVLAHLAAQGGPE